MIIEQLSNSFLYYPVDDRLEKALRYLQETDFSSLPVGKYEIDGTHVFALVQETTTKPLAEGFWEAHRRYIDIHCVLVGEERIGFAFTDKLDAEPYEKEKDFQVLRGEGAFCTVLPGMFMVLMPHDAHMPCLAVTEPAPLRKVVMKVEVKNH